MPLLRTEIEICILSKGGVSHSFSPSKNENKCKGRNKQYFDRGDSKIATIQYRSPSTRTSWPNRPSTTSSSTQTEHLKPVRKRRRCRQPNLSRKDTARLRCSEGTFRVHKIYGDGNCMFRALSYILWQNEDEHQTLRTMVVEHVKDNWQEYGPFVMAEWNIPDREEYCQYMSMVGTFASELECTVATRIHRMNLSIYREISEGMELEEVFHSRVHGAQRTARLLFRGRSDSGHYDVLLPDWS